MKVKTMNASQSTHLVVLLFCVVCLTQCPIALASDRQVGHVQYAQVMLSPAQVRDMHIYPVELVANPGPGYRIEAIIVTLTLTIGIPRYDGGSDLRIGYYDGSINPPFDEIPAAFMTVRGYNYLRATPTKPYAMGTPRTISNMSLAIEATGWGFTGGNADLVIDIWYAIVPSFF
jgi:hypothetical protein